MSGWTDAQARTFARSLVRRLGPGVRFMTLEVRLAFLHRECLSIVLSQVSESVSVADVRSLLGRMAQATKWLDDDGG